MSVFTDIENPATIRVREVTLLYADRRAKLNFALSVDALDLAPRKINAIYGTNGSGKTTLLRAVAGCIRPASGSIEWTNVSSARPRPGIDHVFVTQAGPLPHWTVRENVLNPLLAAGIHAQTAAARTTKFLDLLGLTGLEHRYAHQLSAGQQQRTILARAAVLNPKVLLLDEILSAQSEMWCDRIADVLADYCAHGGLVALICHDPDWVRQHASRVVHLVAAPTESPTRSDFCAGYDGEPAAWFDFRRQRLRAERSAAS